MIWLKRIASYTWLVFGLGTIIILVLYAFDVGYTRELKIWQIFTPLLFTISCYTLWLLWSWLKGLPVAFLKAKRKAVKASLLKSIRARDRYSQNEPEWSAHNMEMLREEEKLRILNKKISRKQVFYDKHR